MVSVGQSCEAGLLKPLFGVDSLSCILSSCIRIHSRRASLLRQQRRPRLLTLGRAGDECERSELLVRGSPFRSTIWTLRAVHHSGGSEEQIVAERHDRRLNGANRNKSSRMLSLRSLLIRRSDPSNGFHPPSFASASADERWPIAIGHRL